MHVTIYDAALREPESRVLDRAPCESAESLFENLCQNWAKRADELARFERELCATREAVQLSSDESDFDTVDKDDRACSRACDEDTRDSSARPRRNESTFCSEPPAKRRAKQRIKSFVTEESDADEDTEISLREILSRAVEDSVALRRRRVEKETERRKIIDTARERRDAGRTIARNLKRWHTRRMRKICVVQSVCRRWLALRRVRAVRDRRERLTRMFWVWCSTLVRARRLRACVRIQSSWRGYATRRSLHEDKVRRERVKRRVEEIVKRYVERHERAKRACAAQQIQRAWRAFIRFSTLRRMNIATLQIQRVWRGARTRKAVRSYRESTARRNAIEFDLESADENDFMDDDDDENAALRDVLDIVTRSTAERIAEPIERARATTSRARAASARQSDDSASTASREHYNRRHQRHLREQSKRRRREALQTSSTARFAAFRSNVARSTR